MKKLFLIFALFLTLFSCTDNNVVVYGTWTPVVYETSGTATYNGNIVSADYTIDDNVVFFEAVITDIETIGTPQGQLAISGLPGILQSESAATIFFFSDGDVNYYSVVGRILGNASVIIYFYYQDGFDADLDPLFYETFNGGGDIRISGFYFIEIP